MGGAIGARNGGDWMPQAGQRMQPRVQKYAGEDDDIAAQSRLMRRPAQAYARQTAQHAEPQYYADQETYRQPQAQPQAYVQHAEARAPQRAQYNGAATRQPAQPQQQRTAPQGYLAAHAVEKSFGNRKVVKGASLYVRRGEAVGLLGPNGAGKTTIFYMITGLITADRGRVELDGHDVTALPMYQRARLGIGYLPQEASIFRGLNVEDNIRAVLEVVEPDTKRRERDLDALLDEFNITQLRKTPSIALSGGERRRCRDRPRARDHGRTTCCSTSRSPASIRSRSATFRRWCAT